MKPLETKKTRGGVGGKLNGQTLTLGALLSLVSEIITLSLTRNSRAPFKVYGFDHNIFPDTSLNSNHLYKP